jgi:hypothetical protein
MRSELLASGLDAMRQTIREREPDASFDAA